MNIRKIGIEDAEYPASLKHIHDAPGELFVCGRILARDKNAVAVVGTRTPTYYGLEKAEKLSYDLASFGITVVSGMARGIDSAAHRGALKAGGRTIAVLGSGHNRIYPPENRKLYGQIAENGAVISELPENTAPLKDNFPARNRIISGLSLGAVVIEAAERSGSLITASLALEQGRDVFALPGCVGSTQSKGTHMLIKEGAKLVEDVSDIIDELKYVLDIESAPGAGDTGTGPSGILLSDNEKEVFNVLGKMPKQIDRISQEVSSAPHKVSEILLRLEIKKLVKTLPGENFVRWG